MGLELPRSSFVMVMQCLVVLTLPHIISCYSYPVFGTKRYARSAGRSAYGPAPMSRRYSEYQAQDYEDGYPQEDYSKYQLVPHYGYIPVDYYRPKSQPRSEGYGYYDEQAPNDPMDDLQEEMIQEERGSGYPYGQETWYEGSSRYENNAEANAAFLQNLIIAQMYQDAAASAAVNAGNPSRYAAAFPFMYTVLPNEDYDDRNFHYGLPTRGDDEKERAKEYFRKEEDEEVKELEQLRKGNKKKQNKNKEGKKKGKGQKNKNIEKNIGNMEDELMQQMDREMRWNERKHVVPMGEGIVLQKKQLYPSEGMFVDLPEAYQSAVTGKPVRANELSLNNLKEREKNPASVARWSTAAPSSTSTPTAASSTSRTSHAGQKEVVLPRPATPIRPLMSIRSPKEPSVYDTIKQLLTMEQNLRQGDLSRPQKRFVANEDQLTAELSGLKKLSA